MRRYHTDDRSLRCMLGALKTLYLEMNTYSGVSRSQVRILIGLRVSYEYILRSIPGWHNLQALGEDSENVDCWIK